MEQEVITLILKNFNKSYNDIAKPKHGKSPEISYGDLISAFVKYNSAKEARVHLGLAEQTMNRILKKCFPEVKLMGGGQTWSHYLLTSVDHKKCFKCEKIKPIEDFLKEGSCKECRHIYNTTEIRRQANRIHQQDFYHSNKEYFRQKKAKYRAIKINACPKWADLEAIKQFYYNCPIEHHVDHIIPLQGKYVCGLHVEYNLQYLPASENCKKSNYHESEEFWK
jgi:hypothetical protein